MSNRGKTRGFIKSTVTRTSLAEAKQALYLEASGVDTYLEMVALQGVRFWPREEIDLVYTQEHVEKLIDQSNMAERSDLSSKYQRRAS